MTIEPTYLLLVPVGILIAVAYTSTGISGANFWVAVFSLGLGLDPRVAFWLALVSMLFGSSSGLHRHALQGTVDYGLAGRMLLVSVPAAVVGSLVSPRLPVRQLALAFGVFALVYGLTLLRTALVRRARAVEGDGGGRRDPWAVAVVGGLCTGLISVGIGALLLPRMLRHPRCAHHARAVGTTLLVVFLTSLAAVLARLESSLVDDLMRRREELLGVLLFVVPAVVIGGQLGPRLARRVEARTMRIYVAGLLVLVGGLMILRFF